MPPQKANEAPLSILIVYDCVYPDTIGGVEHRNYNIAAELTRRGHRVTLAGWPKDASRRENKPNVLELPFKTTIHGSDGKRSSIAALRFAAATLFIPLRDYDVVETANIPYLHLIPLAIRSRLAGKPLVVTWHEYWAQYWKTYVGSLRAPVFAAIEWICAQLGHSVSAVSGFTGDRLRTHRRCRDGVPIVPCGVAIDDIAAAVAGAERQRATLVYAGRLIPEKRLDLAISALSYTRNAPEMPVLRIVGDGPDRTRLEDIARKMGLSGRVSFVGRLQSSRDVWRELASARVAIQPSSREGFGMFPLEALACGTPVVYCESTESALSDFITDGEQGLRAQASAISLAEKIDLLLESDETWCRMSDSALRKAADYRWEIVSDRAEALFYDALRR